MKAREELTRLVSRRRGRRLTESGRKGLSQARISEKLWFIALQIDSWVYRMSYNVRRTTGTIVSNPSLIRKDYLARAVEELARVFAKHPGMSTRQAPAYEGEFLGTTQVRSNRVAIGMVCTVTANGILLKEGIPVKSRYGVELEEGKPLTVCRVD